MKRHLVWIPKNGMDRIGDVPDDVEVVAIPDDPINDPRIGEVEFLVLPILVDWRAILAKMESLKVVQTLSAGVDDSISQMPSGVTLCGARGVHSAAVSEWVVAAVLAGQKEFPFFHGEQLAGHWTRRPTKPLLDSSILFLGYGSIAQAAEDRLAPFGAKISRIARRPRDGVQPLSALPELLGDADVVIAILPRTDETHHLINERFLADMKEGALLVNAGRGSAVDTDALIAALTAGRIRAVLDVTDPEPLPEGHPLFAAPGLLVTPHIAIASSRAQERVFQGLVTEQIRRFASGEPLENAVDAGY
jgi:phosphoglycerate dehydrogenase-like enzyme